MWLARLGYHDFADPSGRDFAIRGNSQLLHDRTYRRFNLPVRHRPLLQRAVEADAQLARIELLATAIALDDHWQFQFDRFQRRETLAAGLAFAPLAPAAFADEMKKDTMSKDTMAKDQMKKDTMAKDNMGKDNMAKGTMKKDDAMDKDNMSKDGMKK